MAFDFVIETPTQRRVNRNNLKLIQKRATQAGAKTRSDQKRKKEQTDLELSADRQHEQTPVSALASYVWPSLALSENSAFQARFGERCYMVYLPETNRAQTASHKLICNPTTSVLQQRLLDAFATTSHVVDANQIFKIATLTSAQFLSYVPSLYSSSPLLDAAIECLFARMNLAVPLLAPSSTTCMPATEDTPYRLYGKALKCLRSELQDPDQRDLAHLWYATKLLTLYELLTMGNESGWVWHAAGAARILYKIGPESIYSEFQLSLLASQLHIQVAETFFTDKPCYLADPLWQLALRRTILPAERYSYRSCCSITLWAIGARLPNVLQTLTSHIHGEAHGRRLCLKLIRNAVADIEAWRNIWHDELHSVCRNLSSDVLIRHQALNILLAFYMLVIICYRMLIAHKPRGMDEVEVSIFNYCSRSLALEELMSPKLRREQQRSIYLKVARATQTTSPDWISAIHGSETIDTIDADTFDAWCISIGRRSDIA